VVIQRIIQSLVQIHRKVGGGVSESNRTGSSAVSDELSVWCANGCFEWQQDGVVVSHPVDDPAGAATLISALFRRPGRHGLAGPAMEGDRHDTGRHDSADVVRSPTGPPRDRPV
jgi:hypothetical protein